MVTKVGSAGHIVESVIQYPIGNTKTDNSITADNSRGDKRESDGNKNLKINKHPDRVMSSSEFSSSMPKMPSKVEKNSAQKVSELEREAGAIIGSEATDELQLAKNGELAMDLSQEAIKITVEDVNKKLAPTGSNVQFTYHEKTRRYSFKVLDSEGNIIREVPPEKSLDMVAKMFELAGILVDEKL